MKAKHMLHIFHVCSFSAVVIPPWRLHSDAAQIIMYEYVV